MNAKLCKRLRKQAREASPTGEKPVEYQDLRNPKVNVGYTRMDGSKFYVHTMRRYVKPNCLRGRYLKLKREYPNDNARRHSDPGRRTDPAAALAA